MSAIASSRRSTTRVDATIIVCPTCGAWIGWACEGPDYGYHAAGYHLSRQVQAIFYAYRDADLSAETKGGVP